ncbi:MAG: PhnD/SsuA/transferrin family substrate-binding protein [Chloroflexi bacterium]|jgi:ABC-type phosphate/phosphonate transport system substrate-binding protein|nr:PhnD/SsuA/transferrin family substrate-binding protein [Chloroflexota bacterium]MBT4072462.1 PhnD/SsuA/transferrin family substrate-binding protein [Chloroflexota bacterium]MBT4515867.1 PhnD/SsuA/transferrin family substrate-binding protein [Chloroflexota bacterium]MBT5319273.1 PhnD/SsuA/transferrin family substrate-binding protein [Chloroflexota bacterium]MBT6682943.1 PhnD/SsuA/transferrin family substrate-binding protein [Chloroflexota bacterium]
MIVNARMYSVTPAVGELWQELLANVVRASGGNHEVLDYPPPQPLGPLWARDDKAAVFMCGLPWSLSDRDDDILVAPVPSPEEYGGEPIYWSYLVVPADSKYKSVRDTYGGRLALTTNESQSGYYAALHMLMDSGGKEPLFSELVGPTITVPENVKAVAEGRADLAAIDSYGYDLLSRHVPELVERVRVVGTTEKTPIPILSSSGSPSPELREAFLDAHNDSANSELMQELLLDRFVVPDPETYSPYPARRARVNAHWSMHRLSATENEALAPNYG